MNVGAVAEWGRVYPTGTVDQAARQDAVGVYRGILASAPVVVAGIISEDRHLFPIFFGLVTEVAEC